VPICPKLLESFEYAPVQTSTFEALEYLQIGLQSPLFMSIIVLLCWALWTERNDLTFQGIQPTIQKCHLTFVKELKLLLHRVKMKHKQYWKNG
jgi:hypothetical protein